MPDKRASEKRKLIEEWRKLQALRRGRPEKKKSTVYRAFADTNSTIGPGTPGT